MGITEWRDQKFHPRPTPRLFVRPNIFKTETETFFLRPNAFETGTKTFFETKYFGDRYWDFFETEFFETIPNFFLDQMFSRLILRLFLRPNIFETLFSWLIYLRLRLRLFSWLIYLRLRLRLFFKIRFFETDTETWHQIQALAESFPPYGYLSVVSWFSQSSTYVLLALCQKSKLKFDDSKAFWSFFFELKVLNESKYSLGLWVCCIYL